MPGPLTATVYGREALRRLREQQAAAQEPSRQSSLLEQIPADAPMDDATLTVWNGERFIAWDKWMATRPVFTDEEPPKESKAAPVADPRPRGSKEQKGLW